MGLCACGAPVEEAERFPHVPRTRASENQVLRFDGQDDYASTGTAEFPHAREPHTWSLWVNVRSLEGRQALVTMRRDRDAGTQLALDDERVTAFRIYDGSVYVRAAEPLAANTWTHVAYSFNGTTHTLYVNGERVAENELEPNNRTPTSCWLGSFDGYTDFLSGSLDDVRLDFGARSAEELAREAAGEPPEADSVDGNTRIVAFWRFDEASGPLAFDDSSNHNDATLGDGIPENMPHRENSR